MGHGRPAHRSGQSNAPGTKCQFGLVIYRHKREAEKASKTGQAKRCPNCRRWHAV